MNRRWKEAHPDWGYYQTREYKLRRSERQRTRYENNKEWREKRKAYARAYYYRKKQELLTQQTNNNG